MPYTGPDAGSLTVGGELNKLAGNIAIGRNGAGVHWRTDYDRSLLLGEEIAIRLLQEQSILYNEGGGFMFTRFDGTCVKIWDGHVDFCGGGSIEPNTTAEYCEEGFTTRFVGEEDTTIRYGEEGETTLRIGEEDSTHEIGEEDASTDRVGEEGETTLAEGEEEIVTSSAGEASTGEEGEE
jgi:hypothetical protein